MELKGLSPSSHTMPCGICQHVTGMGGNERLRMRKGRSPVCMDVLLARTHLDDLLLLVPVLRLDEDAVPRLVLFVCCVMHACMSCEDWKEDGRSGKPTRHTNTHAMTCHNTAQHDQ